MPTIKYDYTDGASLDLEGIQSGRLIRRAKVKGLTIPANPQETLLAVAAAIAADGKPMGSFLSVNYPNLTLQRMRIDPIDINNPHDFAVQMEYASPSGFIPTVFLISDNSYGSSIQTNLMPWGAQITIPAWTDATNSNIKEAADSPLMSFYRSIRSITFTSVRYGVPTHTVQDYVNYVNQSPWPTTIGGQKQPGWWMLNRYQEDQNVYGGYTTYSGEVISRSWQDWSEYDTLQSQKTGKRVKVADSIIATIQAQAYAPRSFITAPGIIRVMYYDWVDFTALFGL